MGDDFLCSKAVTNRSSRLFGLQNGDAVLLDSPAKRIRDFTTDDSGFAAVLSIFTSQSMNAANTVGSYLDSRVDSNE